MSKDSAHTSKTRATAPKAAKKTTADPDASLALPLSPARMERIAIQKAIYREFGGEREGHLGDATTKQVLAAALGGIEFDPCLDGLLSLVESLQVLSVAVEAKDDLERLDLGCILARLSSQADALAELHFRMMRASLDHVERLVVEAEATA